MAEKVTRFLVWDGYRSEGHGKCNGAAAAVAARSAQGRTRAVARIIIPRLQTLHASQGPQVVTSSPRIIMLARHKIDVRVPSVSPSVVLDEEQLVIEAVLENEPYVDGLLLRILDRNRRLAYQELLIKGEIAALPKSKPAIALAAKPNKPASARASLTTSPYTVELWVADELKVLQSAALAVPEGEIVRADVPRPTPSRVVSNRTPPLQRQSKKTAILFGGEVELTDVDDSLEELGRNQLELSQRFKLTLRRGGLARPKDETYFAHLHDGEGKLLGSREGRLLEGGVLSQLIPGRTASIRLYFGGATVEAAKEALLLEVGALAKHDTPEGVRARLLNASQFRQHVAALPATSDAERALAEEQKFQELVALQRYSWAEQPDHEARAEAKDAEPAAKPKKLKLTLNRLTAARQDLTTDATFRPDVGRDLLGPPIACKVESGVLTVEVPARTTGGVLHFGAAADEAAGGLYLRVAHVDAATDAGKRARLWANRALRHHPAELAGDAAAEQKFQQVVAAARYEHDESFEHEKARAEPTGESTKPKKLTLTLQRDFKAVTLGGGCYVLADLGHDRFVPVGPGELKDGVVTATVPAATIRAAISLGTTEHDLTKPALIVRTTLAAKEKPQGLRGRLWGAGGYRATIIDELAKRADDDLAPAEQLYQQVVALARHSYAEEPDHAAKATGDVSARRPSVDYTQLPHL